MPDISELATINKCVDQLMGQLVSLQEELRIAETRAKGWSPRKCMKLRERIASVEKRLGRAEKLQERLLCSGSGTNAS